MNASRRVLVLTACAIAAAASARAAQSPDLSRARACVDSARVAAGEDRHGDAIRWYRRAIAIHPPLEADLGRELGNQYTWAEKPDTAIQWYQSYLSHHPDDVESKIGVARALAWDGRLDEAIAAYQALLPRDDEFEHEVQLGIAQTTSWKDDLARARSQYDVILAEDPDHLEARLGQARVINWSGRHRESAALYRDILADHPGNAEAREGLARAYYWSGQPEEARAVIEDGERTRGLAALDADMDQARAPGGSYTLEHSTDTDEIERWFHTFRAGFSTSDVTRLHGEYGHGRFDQPGRPDVSRDWIAAVYQHRFSATVMLHAAVGYQWNSFDRSLLGPESYWQDDFNLATVDAFVTLTPRDWWRFDVSLFHGSLSIPDAIFRGISVTEISGGWDLRLKNTLMLVSSVETGWYSDANSRLGLGEKLVWQPLWRLPIGVANRITSSTGAGYFGFSHTNDNGYYDPRQYLSVYEEVALDFTFSPRLRARLAGRLGLDRENGEDWFDTGRIEVSGSASIWRGLSLTAGYYNSNSRLDSREGYAADGFYLTLDYLRVP
jgi:Flp pilus assembly protein TadD